MHSNGERTTCSEIGAAQAHTQSTDEWQFTTLNEHLPAEAGNTAAAICCALISNFYPHQGGQNTFVLHNYSLHSLRIFLPSLWTAKCWESYGVCTCTVGMKVNYHKNASEVSSRSTDNCGGCGGEPQKCETLSWNVTRCPTECPAWTWNPILLSRKWSQYTR